MAHHVVVSELFAMRVHATRFVSLRIISYSSWTLVSLVWFEPLTTREAWARVTSNRILLQNGLGVENAVPRQA